MLRCIFITGYFRVRADLFVSFLWEVTNIKRAECCSIDYVQYCDHSLPFQAAAITVNCRDDHSDADKLLKLSNADKLKLLKSNANSEQIYLRIAFPCHSLSACLLATENSMKIFNNASEHYCSFSFSNPISSRRKRFQHSEKQLNDNSVWGPDSNRKLCPLLIVAFLFVPVIASIAQRVWLISMHFNSF